MKEAIRETLRQLGTPEWLDLLVEYGAKRKDVKDYKSVILQQVTDEAKTLKGRHMPPVEVIHTRLMNLEVPRRMGQLQQTDIGGGPKIESVRLILQTLKMLAYGYRHPIVIHPNYSGMPAVGNLKGWCDQWGYNIFDTPKRKLAERALLKYEREHGKQLYKAEVRKSDPVEYAPPPFKGGKK